MRRLREWMDRLLGTVRPRRTDDDLREELLSHLEFSGERGAVEPAMEAVRDQRALPWVRDLGRDVRYGCRGLLREPAFSVIAIISLALGIGANIAILGLVEAIEWRALPVDRPQTLVFLDAVGTQGGGGAPPYPCFERFRREAPAFAGMAAFATDHLRVGVDGAIEQVFGQVASGNYFELLGLRAAAGRLLTQADERLDPPAAVLGYGYWQRRFGGDPGAIGKTISYKNQAFTIVGVTPASFWGLQPGRQVDITLPITAEREYVASAGDWWFEAIGRLGPQSTPEQATVQLDTIFQSFMMSSGPGQLGADLRTRYFDHMQLTPASRGMGMLRSRFSKPLFGLAIVAGLVLVIACANLSSLQLVRGAARGREFAIRLATGAGTGRLFRQLFTESGVLFVCGTAAASVVAYFAIVFLKRFFAVGRNPVLLDVSVDGRLVALSIGLVFLVALPTALWPALRALRADPQKTLRDSEHRVTGSRRLRATMRVLIAVQVATSFALLVGALMLVKTMVNLRRVDLGFEPHRVVTLSMDAATSWKEVLERVRALPGVQSASLSVMTPLSGRDSTTGIQVAGFQSGDATDRLIHVNQVSEDYFRTFGIRVLSGRAPSEQDATRAARVVVINQAAATLYFPGRDPVGQLVRFTPADAPYEIVGVVADTRHMSVREAAPRFAFIPLWQPLRPVSRLTVAAASDLPSASVVRAITRGILAIQPNTLVSDVLTAEEQIDATLVSERLLSTLALVFAGVAVGLAAVGVYGVLSYSVAQRRTEFGIQLALGASRARIAADLVRRLSRDLAAGMAIAVPVSFTGAGLARDLLYGVTAADPANYFLSAVTLTVVAALAAAVPARRACRIDPCETLRRQ